MKILIRMYGLMIVTILVALIIIDLINMNIITNELNNISSLAVGQTQKYIKDLKIEELENNTSFSISDDTYRNYFINRFSENVKDASIYDLSNVSADYKHGLLYVSINCKKYPKVKTKKLINIIEIDGEYGKGDRYKKGYSLYSEKRSYKKNEVYIYPLEWSAWQKEKPTGFSRMKEEKETISLSNSLNSLIRNKEWPKNIFSIEENITSLDSYNIDVYSYINTASTITAAYWYPGLRLYYLKDGKEVDIDSRSEAKYGSGSAIKGSESIKLDNLYLDITEFKPRNGYESKLNAMRFKNASITYTYPMYQYVTKWSEAFDTKEIVEDEEYKLYSYEMVYPRYIERSFYETLSIDSIWRKDEYQNVLNYYFTKYEEPF